MIGGDPAHRREGPTELTAHGSTYRPLLLSALPPEVPFGVIGRVLPPSLSAEARLELHRLPRAEALEILDRAGAVAEAELAAPAGGGAERPEVERTAETARAMARRVGTREQDLWRLGVVIAGRAPSPRRAERVLAELMARLTSYGFRARAPTHAVEESLAPCSGDGLERRPPGYWHTLHTDGVAAFFPFVEESVAEPEGVLTGLLLEDASPVFLNRWEHASHSWGVFGTTGSGKSFAAALLAMRSRWMYPDLELILLDPLGEFVPWARALGGEVLELGPEAAGRLNPLDPLTTGGDRVEKAARVGPLLRALFPSLNDEEVARLDGAIHGLYSDGPNVPVFSDLLRVVEADAAPNSRLATLVRVLTHGSLAHLNGPTTVSPTGSPLVVSFRGVPEEHLPFHLAYVLEWVYGRLRTGERRRLVVVDESHFLVRHPPTAEFLDGLLRHVRHYRAGFLLLSQHPEDFLKSVAGRSILRNLRATLLFRLTNVSLEVREFFQLTNAEGEWLPRARLPREAGYSEALLRLGSAHLPIAVVASTPEFEFLRRNMTGTDVPLERNGPGADGRAPLSDPDRTNPVDERRGDPPGGGAFGAT